MARNTVLTLGMAALAVPAMAQVAPDNQDVPEASLDLPANLQIFGKADPNIRKPTAIVNETVITGTDVDQRVNLIVGFNKLQLAPADIDRLRLQILRQLIDETLQIQAAAAEKITVSKDEIDRSFASVARNLEKSQAEMRTWLRQIGTSERSIRRQIEGELAWNRLIRRRIDVTPSEAEINAIIARLVAARGTPEYHVFEIFLYATADRAQEVVAAEQRMIQQLQEGKTPFEYLARTNSEASTRATGGDLGWIRLPMLQSPVLEETIGKMRAGQIAGPIELPAGFSIIYLAETRQVLTSDPRDAKLSLKQLSIAFPAGTTEAQATDRAAEFAKATSAMQGCGDADRVAGLIGATVVNNDSKRLRDMDVLEDTISKMQIGQVTPPFGSIDQGVRVLVLCGRDDPQEASDPSRDVIENQIVEARTSTRAQRMLRDLRRDALIEYR